MPSPHRTLTRGIASAAIRDHEFGRASGTASDACARNGVGIELELLTDDGGQDGDHRRLTLDRAEAVRSSAGPLPAGSALTIEPGGQLEISTQPMPTLTDACQAAAHDLLVLDRCCDALDVGLYALGQDPVREPSRVTDAPRYRAMEAYFEAIGGAGRTMMTNTASIQLNVGLGDSEAEATRRWQIANAIGPAMAAAFANSPFADGAPSGWKSTRLRTWWQLDPSRALPVPIEAGADPTEVWTDYAMAARVMLIRTSPDDYLPAIEPMTFDEWMRDGHAAGFPTIDDLRYHLTTLFPPVRPRGWFEIRAIDALPTPFWHVAAAVITTLVMTADLDADVRRSTAFASSSEADADHLWIDASQLGLGHPALARTAKDLFALASAALDADGCETASELVDVYRRRWVDAERSPADDAHDRWRLDGTLFPRRESPVPMDEILAEVTRP